MLTLDEFALRQVFHRLKDADGNPVYWRSVTEDDSGYLLVWPDGECLHTYHYPPYMESFRVWPWRLK